MTNPGVGVAVMILVIFGVMFSMASYMVAKTTMKKHWSKYRCNPGSMMFASHVGEDASENLSHCTSHTQSATAQFSLRPHLAQMSQVHSAASQNSGSVEHTRSFMSSFRTGVGGGLTAIFSTFQTALAELQIESTKTKDLMSKVSAALSTLGNWLDAGTTAVEVSQQGGFFSDVVNALS